MPISRTLRTRLVIAGGVLMLSACSSQRATYVPDGRRGFAISCGGFLDNWSSCLVKAGRACGNNGYETIKGSDEDRSILIACKVPEIAHSAEPAAH